MFRILTLASLLFAGVYQPCCGCCHAAPEQTARAESAVTCPSCANSSSEDTPERECPCRHRQQSRFSNAIAEQEVVADETTARSSAATEVPKTLTLLRPVDAVTESPQLHWVSLTVLLCRFQC